MNETDPDMPDEVLRYDAAMGGLRYDAAMGGPPGRPKPGNDAFVEFLRVMLHRYGADKSAANCCRSWRGFHSGIFRKPAQQICQTNLMCQVDIGR